MKFILCVQRKNEVKVFGKNNILDSLVMVTAICDAVAEKVKVEKRIRKDVAIHFVIDSILQSYSKLRQD